MVNEAFVRAVSPDAPLLGRQVRLLGVTETPLEVVGVVSDARPFRLGGQERPRLFYPYSQFASTRVIGMVRIAAGGAPPVNAIRGILRELEPAAPMFEVRTVADLLSDGHVGAALGIGAAGRVRRHGAPAGQCGRDGRSRLRGQPAHAGVRHTDRARLHAGRCQVAGSAPGNVAGRSSA